MASQENGTLHASDYRTLLQQEMMRRIAKNSSYSLRAFARDLDVSPGYLSSLMGRRKNLSESRAAQILEKLGWPERRSQIFSLLVRLETVEIETEEKRLIVELQRLQAAENEGVVEEDLSLEYFRVIGEWYHAAVLEMLSLDGAQHRTDWIADRLSLSLETVDDALNRLCKVGLLRREGDKWLRSQPHVVVQGIPSETVRGFHRSYLRAAVDAVDLGRESRILLTSLIPVAANSLAEIEDRFEKVASEIIEMNAGKPKEQLFCLSVAFHRVDKDARLNSDIRYQISDI